MITSDQIARVKNAKDSTTYVRPEPSEMPYHEWLKKEIPFVESRLESLALSNPNRSILEHYLVGLRRDLQKSRAE